MDQIRVVMSRLEQTYCLPEVTVLPISRTKSRFLSLHKHNIFTLDFPNSWISRTNFRFPWSFEKSGFYCIAFGTPVSGHMICERSPALTFG